MWYHFVSRIATVQSLKISPFFLIWDDSCEAVFQLNHRNQPSSLSYDLSEYHLSHHLSNKRETIHQNIFKTLASLWQHSSDRNLSMSDCTNSIISWCYAGETLEWTLQGNTQTHGIKLAFLHITDKMVSSYEAASLSHLSLLLWKLFQARQMAFPSCIASKRERGTYVHWQVG